MLVHIGHFFLIWNLGPLLLIESDGMGIIMYTLPMSGPLPKKTMCEAGALIIYTSFCIRYNISDNIALLHFYNACVLLGKVYLYIV